MICDSRRSLLLQHKIISWSIERQLLGVSALDKPDLAFEGCWYWQEYC